MSFGHAYGRDRSTQQAESIFAEQLNYSTLGIEHQHCSRPLMPPTMARAPPVQRPMSRPNFFFAFPFDGSFVRQLPPPPAFFRLFHPDDVHLTLSFLGGCSPTAAERALAALDDSLQQQPLPPLDVSLGAVVPMGPAHAYSALSALLDRGREPTCHVIASLRHVLSEAALGRRERREPKPHVTIARPRRHATETARRAGVEWAAQLDLRGVGAFLDRIALYTWSDGNRRDRLFRVIAERSLKSAGLS